MIFAKRNKEQKQISKFKEIKKMSWNNAYRRKQFEEKQKKQVEEYRALGMTEEQIQAMYEFDLEQFRSDRRFYSHTQSLLPDTFDENEDNDEKLSIFELFKDVFTTTIEEAECKSRYWWVDEIGEYDLLGGVRNLNSEQIEILTLIVFENYSQKDAAEKMGIPYRSFKRKIQQIKILLIIF